jgi:hypothetical protein
MMSLLRGGRAGFAGLEGGGGAVSGSGGVVDRYQEDECGEGKDIESSFDKVCVDDDYY